MRRRIVAIVVILAVVVALVGGIVAIAHMVTNSGENTDAAHHAQSSQHSASDSTKSTNKTDTADKNATDSGSADTAQSQNSSDTTDQKSAKKEQTTEEKLACKASQMEVTLTADNNTVGVGGTVTFTTTVTYKGKNQCLTDLSTQKEVLTIYTGAQTEQSQQTKSDADQANSSASNSNGGKVVWQSSVCSADPRKLLFAQGAAGSDQSTDTVTTTWNTNATGDTCEDDTKLPHVIAGTYQAQVTFPDIKGLQSQIVPIVVQ